MIYLPTVDMDTPFDVKKFYNDLSSDYHLMFADWRASVLRQSDALDRFIQTQFSPKPKTVLDCSCGVGTQSIALALKGYQVRGSDIAKAALERAKKEAESFNVSISFQIADMLALETEVDGTYDLVMSCDNSVSHFIDDKDLFQAAKSIKTKIKPGGFFLATTRDYDELLKNRIETTYPAVAGSEGSRQISFQIWKWAADLKTYDFELFMFLENRGQWNVQIRHGRYRALKRDEFNQALVAAGFKNIKWHFPDETGFYQPIVSAKA